MAMAIALVVVVVATTLFHFLSPWWATPLASNWKQMDDTLTITLVITGIFFIIINLFVAYTVWRFRHREGQRGAWQPENRKLELWLIGVSTVGIMALLAPGLFVYADYVRPPREATVVEAVGQQWQWAFRLPGKSGQLGTSDARFVDATNPLGVNPDDPRGLDNIVVLSPELHLPVNRPVRMLLRSRDVLHDFYVPEFRARMNLVPGMVTSFWFTPTKTGRYEILCAQLCGVGHFNMRGVVVVEEQAAYDAWLAKQPTFAVALAKAKAPPPPIQAGNASVAPSPLADEGRALAQAKGCAGCHSVDGNAGVGPTWKGLFGKTETFADGSNAPVDEAFLKHEIEDPQSRLVKGFGPLMPKIQLSEAEVNALIAYIKSVSAAGTVNTAATATLAAPLPAGVTSTAPALGVVNPADAPKPPKAPPGPPPGTTITAPAHGAVSPQ